MFIIDHLTSGTFEASNTDAKSGFRFTNKHKADVQRQLLVHDCRKSALAELRPDAKGERPKKKSRTSYLQETRPKLVENSNGTVDMRLQVAIAASARGLATFKIQWHLRGHRGKAIYKVSEQSMLPSRLENNTVCVLLLSVVVECRCKGFVCRRYK